MSATATLSPTHRPHLTLRRIGAVFAGLLTIVVLSTAADAVLHATGVYPPFPRRMADGLFLLATAYRIVFGAAAMWEFGPGWYSLAIIAIAHPCAWTGARLGAKQLRAG